jgi:hypothetical protein
MDKSLENYGVFANVDSEGVGRPAAHPLDGVVWNTCQSEGRSSSRPQRMASNVVPKSGLQTRDKPGRGRGEAMGSEPKLGVEGEKRVTGGNITLHKRHRVKGRVGFAEDDDLAALVKTVGLMKRKLEGKLIGEEMKSVAANNFFGGTLGRRIGNGHLPKAQESRKPRKEHGKEKEIVMRGGAVSSKQRVEIVFR